MHTAYCIPNTEYQILNTKYCIPNTEHRILNTKYWILHTAYYIPHTKYWILHIAYHIPNTKYWIPNTEYWISHTEYWIPNTKYSIPNFEYWILNTEYGILNTEYRIPNTTYRLPHICGISANSSQRSIDLQLTACLEELLYYGSQNLGARLVRVAMDKTCGAPLAHLWIKIQTAYMLSPLRLSQIQVLNYFVSGTWMRKTSHQQF